MNSAERIHHPDPAIVLTVIEVLRQQFHGTAGFSRGQNHSIPKGKLPTGLESEAKPENSEGIVNHRPLGKIPNQCGGFFRKMPPTDEIDVELLKHLHADGGPAGLVPCLLNDGLRDATLGRSIKVISVEQNIRVEKTFNGHEFPHG